MSYGVRLFLRNSGYAFLAHAMTTLVAFVYAVVLARVLGTESYAVLAFGFAWYLTFIALSYLGIDVVLARSIGRDRTDASRLCGSTLVLRLMAGVVVAATSVVAGQLLAQDGTSRTLLAVMGAALVARTVWLWCQAVFTAFEDTRHGLFIDLGCRPLELALGASVLALGGGVVGIGIVHAGAWTIQALTGILVVIRRVTPLDLTRAREDAGRLVRNGWPGALYSLAVIWFLQAPIVLFTAVGNEEDRGPFALSVQIIGYVMVIPYLAASVGLPLLSRSAARQDGRRSTVVKSLLVVVPLGGLVLGLVTWALAPTLVELVFGSQFSLAGHMLQLGIWLVIPMTLAVSLQQVIFAGQEARWSSIAPALAGVVAMAVAFVPATLQWGYAGAFTATGVGLVVWAGGALVVVGRSTLRVT